MARTGAALATVVALGVAPAAIGLGARWVTGERMTLAWTAGTAAAVTGCALLLAPAGAGVDAPGLLLAVVAGLCYGLYTVFAKKLAGVAPAAQLPALSALSLLAGAVPLAPWMVNGTSPVQQGATLALTVWLGVATTALAYWLFTTGLARLRATTVGTLSLAEPLAAALIGVLLLHEHLSPVAWTGGALILIGMITMCLPPRQADPWDAAEEGPGPQASAATRAVRNRSVVAPSRTAIRSQSGPRPGKVSPRRTAKPASRNRRRTSAAPGSSIRTNEAAGVPCTRTPGTDANPPSR